MNENGIGRQTGACERVVPREGILVVFDITGPTRWLVLRDPQAMNRFLLVPADDARWVGSKDVALGVSTHGVRALRCGFTLRIGAEGLREARFRDEKSRDRLDAVSIARVRKKHLELASGILGGSIREREQDSDPGYVDRMGIVEQSVDAMIKTYRGRYFDTDTSDVSDLTAALFTNVPAEDPYDDLAWRCSLIPAQLVAAAFDDGMDQGRINQLVAELVRGIEKATAVLSPPSDCDSLSYDRFWPMAEALEAIALQVCVERETAEHFAQNLADFSAKTPSTVVKAALAWVVSELSERGKLSLDLALEVLLRLNRLSPSPVTRSVLRSVLQRHPDLAEREEVARWRAILESEGDQADRFEQRALRANKDVDECLKAATGPATDGLMQKVKDADPQVEDFTSLLGHLAGPDAQAAVLSLGPLRSILEHVALGLQARNEDPAPFVRKIITHIFHSVRREGKQLFVATEACETLRSAYPEAAANALVDFAKKSFADMPMNAIAVFLAEGYEAKLHELLPSRPPRFEQADGEEFSFHGCGLELDVFGTKLVQTVVAADFARQAAWYNDRIVLALRSAHAQAGFPNEGDDAEVEEALDAALSGYELRTDEWARQGRTRLWAEAQRNRAASLVSIHSHGGPAETVGEAAAILSEVADSRGLSPRQRRRVHYQRSRTLLRLAELEHDRCVLLESALGSAKEACGLLEAENSAVLETGYVRFLLGDVRRELMMERARLEMPADPEASIERSLRDYLAAQQVFTKSDYPVLWAKTRLRIASLLPANASRVQLDEAIEDIESTQEILNSLFHPGWAARAEQELGRAFAQRARATGSSDLREASKHLWLAYRLFNTQGLVGKANATSEELCEVVTRLGEVEGGTACQRAVDLIAGAKQEWAKPAWESKPRALIHSEVERELGSALGWCSG